MKTIYIAVVALLLLSCSLSTAANQIVDTFDTGEFFLSSDGRNGQTNTAVYFLGSRRSVQINSRDFAPATTVTSTLAEPVDSVSFEVDGISIAGERPISLLVAYGGSGPHDISSFDAFEIDLSDVVGTGFVIVQIGSSSIVDADTLRAPITSTGTLEIPFSSVNFNTDGFLDAFTSVRFIFEAETEQFSMTLEEIRLVPEPSVGVLAVLGLVVLSGWRRRS